MILSPRRRNTRNACANHNRVIRCPHLILKLAHLRPQNRSAGQAERIDELTATVLDLDRRVGWLEEHLARQALEIVTRARQESQEPNHAED